MPDRPQTASGYPPGQGELVRATCLYIATRLGDLMDDLVVIGGFAPMLLVDQNSSDGTIPAHVGTMDLDIGLSLALFDQQRYTELTERLRRAGLSPDTNDQGNPTRQRWKLDLPGTITVDFLIPPSYVEDRGGTIRNIEADFAAIIIPGLPMAFRDRCQIRLTGQTILGEHADRGIWVCGPGAYVVLKALAFDNRGENKDAYDLYYVIRNYGAGVTDVLDHLLPLRGEPLMAKALEILRRDFLDPDAVGPRRVAQFLTAGPDTGIQADVVGFVVDLLRSIP